MHKDFKIHAHQLHNNGHAVIIFKAIGHANNVRMPHTLEHLEFPNSLNTISHNLNCHSMSAKSILAHADNRTIALIDPVEQLETQHARNRDKKRIVPSYIFWIVH